MILHDRGRIIGLRAIGDCKDRAACSILLNTGLPFLTLYSDKDAVAPTAFANLGPNGDGFVISTKIVAAQ